MLSYQAFSKSLHDAGYIAMSNDIAMHGWLAIHEMEKRDHGLSAILMDGPPGTGKSFFAHCVSSVLDAELIAFQFVPGTRREDLLYDLDLPRIIRGMAGEDLPKEFDEITSPGVLVRAALSSQNHPTVLLLDELDKANEKIDSFLLEFLQEGVLNLPHVGTVVANPKNLLIVITKNDQRLVTDALLRRIRKVTIKYPAPQIEQQILTAAVPGASEIQVKSLITLANRLRAKPDEMLHVPSTPELISCLQDLQVVPEELTGNVILSWLIRYPEDQKHLQESVNSLAGTFKAARK